MNAFKVYEKAKDIRDYKMKTFPNKHLTFLEKEHLTEKFNDFATTKPRIFKEIIEDTIHWEKFKRLAEMAYSLYLQMNTDTDVEVAKNVKFS